MSNECEKYDEKTVSALESVWDDISYMNVLRAKTTSDWLRMAIVTSLNRNPMDVLADVDLLKATMMHWSDELPGRSAQRLAVIGGGIDDPRNGGMVNV